MSFTPITYSSTQASSFTNPNAPLPAQNTAAGSSEPSHNLPLHLERFGVAEGTVSYLEGGKMVERIFLRLNTKTPTLTLPSTFEGNQSIVTSFSKTRNRHRLDPYIETPPNNLSLTLQQHDIYREDPCESARQTISSLRGTFKLPFTRMTNLADTKTTTITTHLWPYKCSLTKTVFVPLALSHQYIINFGTTPDSEIDLNNTSKVRKSIKHLTNGGGAFLLKISIPKKLNRHPEMCFSILTRQGVIWQCSPHIQTKRERFKTISIQDFLSFEITNSGFFDKTYSVQQLLQDQHPGYFRSIAHITSIQFELESKLQPNGSLTSKTEILFNFSENLPSFIRESPEELGAESKKASAIQETKLAIDPVTRKRSIASHLDTKAVTTYYNGPPTSSPAAPEKDSASKYTAPSSDSPFVKKPRINSSDSTEAPLPQIPPKERPTSGFPPHDPELAEFFASFNSPMDSSLNSPSPPNFDFPPTDDPLKKLLRLLGSFDEARSPSSARLEPIFSSDLFDENRK